MQKTLNIFQNRADLSVISEWIQTGSSVLDLGCGDGGFLDYLIKTKKVTGTGVEINFDNIIECINKGIPVVEHDLNQPFKDFGDKTFDYVILSETIQELTRPDMLIDEILRIGRYGIISFPNFGNLWIRLKLLFTGMMPKSQDLPYNWYDTPNIHLMTNLDFIKFCKNKGITIINSIHLIKNSYKKSLIFPNLSSEGCVALIKR